MESIDADKWSERYYQLCLVLIGQQPVRCNVREVITRADLMIEHLIKRDQQFYEDCQNEQ